MKKLIGFFLLFLACHAAQAQGLTQIIKGTVIDADTKEPLIGASVLVMETNPPIGNITDEMGNFKLTGVPVGRQSLKITYIGYEDFMVNNIIVSSAKEVVLPVELKESLQKLENVVLVAEQEKDRPLNDMATVSARTFSVEETSRYAASFADPSRVAQSFAGVASSSDNNEIVVRGNAPTGLLWRLEGIEIPNPNHFSDGDGASSGGISIISNTVLANSDFMTGAFPAEYGNASSGVFDLRFRNGNPEKREYSVQLGALGVQLAAEGGFKKGGESSYLVNYRYSTTGLLDAIGVKLGGDITPRFQDINFKLNLPTQRYGKFTVFGIGGISYAGEEAVRDSAQWKTRWDRFGENELQHRGALGIANRYNFANQKTYLKNVVGLTYEGTLFKSDTINRRYDLTEVQRTRRNYMNVRWASTLNHKFSARHVLRTGFIVSHLTYQNLSREFDTEASLYRTTLDTRGSTQLLQGFAQWQYRANEWLTLNTGAHYTYLVFNGDQAIEPRVGLQIQLNSRHTLSFGAGMHTRALPISYYLNKVKMPDGSFQEANRDLKMTRAIHQAISHDWRMADDWRLKTEAYYQYLYDVAVDAQGYQTLLNNTGGNTSLDFTNAGKGENYGVEITLEKFLSKGYYMMLATSLFESHYRDAFGVERPTTFNSRYIVNGVAGKEFKVGRERQNILGFNLRLVWRGGIYTTPVDAQASFEKQQTVFDDTRPLAVRAPDFFRLDASASYRINRPKTSWSLNLEMQNVTNRLNQYGEFFDLKEQKVRMGTYTGLIPNLNIRLDF